MGKQRGNERICEVDGEKQGVGMMNKKADV